MPAIGIFLGQVVQTTETVILRLIGIIEVDDVGGVMIPGGVIKRGGRAIGRRIILLGGIFQIICRVVQLSVDDDLYSQPLRFRHQSLQLRLRAEMGIGAVEIAGIVSMVACLVPGSAVKLVVLGRRHPDSGKSQRLDIGKLAPESGPVSALIKVQVAGLVFCAQHPVVRRIPVAETVRHQHIYRVASLQIVF